MKFQGQILLDWHEDVIGRFGEMKLEKGLIKFRGELVDLRCAPALTRLLEIFISSPQGLTTEKIIAYVYAFNFRHKALYTTRYRKSHKHNILKLISRARRLFQTQFSFGKDFHWFGFDLRSHNWTLIACTVKESEGEQRLQAACPVVGHESMECGGVAA